MREQDPAIRIGTIEEAPYETKEALGGLALRTDAFLDGIDVDEVISGMELMLAIQEDLPFVEVKEEQVDCLDAIQEARARGQERALVQMATGLGKTTVAAADAKRFLEDNPGARVLFLSHQNRISDQARERFEMILGSEYSFGNFSGEEQDFHEVDCLFASFQVMHDWREAFLEGEFDYIVIDESHHAKADTYEPTIDYFKPQFMLAMTATPDRYDMKDIRQLFGEEVYKLTLEEAIANNLLAKVDYHLMFDEVTAGKMLTGPDTRSKINRRQLNRNVFVPVRDEEIARLCNEKAESLDGPVKRLVFCKSIEQTEEMAQYFEGAAPIHSDLPAWEIKQMLEKFKSGEIQTLLTVNMFNEGIDVPDVNQVVFLRSTDSVTVFLQQLGRGLRKLGDKDFVQVLDFVANCDRLSMLDAFVKRINEASEQTGIDPNDIFRINGGEFHFDDITQDILNVLADIDSNRNKYRDWVADDSVTYYTNLCLNLNRLASFGDITNAAASEGAPNAAILTRHFNGRLTDLREACGVNPMPVQEGWTYVRDIGAKLGRAYQTVKNVAESIGIEGTPMVGEKGRIGLYYSTDEVDRITQEYNSVDFAPEGWLPAFGIKKAFGIRPVLLGNLTKQLGIQGSVLRTPRGIKSLFYSPGDQHQILDLLAKTPEVPEGWSSVAAIARLTNISEPTIVNLVGKLKITGSLYRAKGGAVGLFFTDEDRDKMAAVFNTLQRAPESGWISMTDIKAQHNLHSRNVLSVASQLGILPTKMRNKKGQTSIYFKDEDFARVHAQIPSTEHIERASDGDLSLREFASLVEVTDATVLKMAKELGVNIEQRKNDRGQVVRMVSQENIDKLLRHPNFNLTIAPEGHMAIRGIADHIGLSEAAVSGLIKRLKLVPKQYKDPVQKNVFGYFSPEQVAQIESSDLVVTPFAPDGFETVYDMARRFTDDIRPSSKLRSQIDRAIKVLELKPARFRHPVVKRILTYYSPDQVSLILQNM